MKHPTNHERSQFFAYTENKFYICILIIPAECPRKAGGIFHTQGKNSVLNVFAIPALQDNYIWCIRQLGQAACIIVDPGEAAPVMQALANNDLKCVAVFITHHHGDHSNGAAELAAHYSIPVYGPAYSKLAVVTHPLADQDRININELDAQFQVLAIPGHTLDHIAYFCEGLLFCGDTLFSAGCGRAFEGTPAQLYQSLVKLMQLPADTFVYCGHEYTLKNLRFAKMIEPHNVAIDHYLQQVEDLRAKNQITLPSQLQLEKAVNPFLRVGQPEVQSFVTEQLGHAPIDAIEIFSVLRQLKDRF